MDNALTAATSGCVAGLEAAWWGWEDAAAEAEKAALATATREALCELLRDIFGPLPFRAVTLAPTVLQWNDATVPRLAQAIYEQRELPRGVLDSVRLRVLADALEEAGGDNDELLAACRQEAARFRGFGVVDALLGKS